MRAIWMSALAAALLTACAGSPVEEQAGAAVEDRKPGAVSGAGAQTNPVQQGQVARVDLTGQKPPAGYSELKDPNNILSKRSIYFDLDSFSVKDEHKALVEAHARYLRTNLAAKMLIQGNTDERGGREYNLALGQRRAEAVRRALALLGVPDAQMEAVSFGKEKPAAQGATEAAFARNRRAEIAYR